MGQQAYAPLRRCDMVSGMGLLPRDCRAMSTHQAGALEKAQVTPGERALGILASQPARAVFKCLRVAHGVG